MASAFDTLILAQSALTNFFLLGEASGALADSKGVGSGDPKAGCSFHGGSLLPSGEGNSIQCDGTANALIDFGSTFNGYQATGEPFSVELLFHPDTFNGSVGDDSYRTIWAYNNNWRLLMLKAGTAILDQFGGGANSGTTTVVSDLRDTTHHIVYTVSSGDAWALWLDGTKIANGAGYTAGAMYLQFLGSYANPATNYPYKGRFQSFAVYNAVLSDADIAAHYAAFVSSATLPVCTVDPVITGGTPQGSTLTCNGGTFTGSPAPTKTYQWKRDGSSIGGATSSTYATVAADLAKSVTCVVTGTNSAGSAVSNASNGITVTAASTTDPRALIALNKTVDHGHADLLWKYVAPNNNAL